MKDRLSELMDGELDDKSAAELLQTLASDRDAVEAWRTYQLISDAMRQGRVLSDGFTARVSARLAAEPTLVASRTYVPGLQRESRRWVALSAAASLAAVALVGWMAFGPETPAPAPVAQVQTEQKPNLVPLPSQANDYLLAHQGFSPRNSLQGMAPFVRSVSTESLSAKP